MVSKPVGVFDSGVGGLTVLSALRKALPQQKFIYVGDTARVPYGTKSAETIHRYTEEIFSHLIQQNVCELIIACNSASSAFQQSSWKGIPVHNVIDPAVDALIETQQTLKKPMRVLLLGTKATIQSGEYETRLFRKTDQADFQFRAQACPLFVPLVEEGVLKKSFCFDIVDMYLSPHRAFRPDIVILGCTHYPLLARQIQKYFGQSTRILDSGKLLAQKFKARNCQKRVSEVLGKIDIWVTDRSENFNKLARQIIGSKVEPKQYDLS